MDIATIVGFVMGVALIVGSIWWGGASPKIFIDVPSILVVFGGAVSAVLLCFPLKSTLTMPLVGLKAIRNKVPRNDEILKQIVSLAETARRDGLLALEARLETIPHPFLKTGIQMAVDGSSPDVVEGVLRSEIEATAGRHKAGRAVMDQVGRFAPAYGMIGTLLGLVMMLADMSDPSKIGAGMAVALLTTLYGAIASNMIFIPLAEKLSYYSKHELHSLEMILRGILAIQQGENPRVIEQKLATFIPPKQRPRPAEL